MKFEFDTSWSDGVRDFRGAIIDNKKKVLVVGCSNDLSKAFDEFRFKYSALSNKTILMSRE